MSLEAFTRYVAERGWDVQEFFYPAGMLEDEHGNPVPDEDFTVRSIVKRDANVVAWVDISDALLGLGEEAWDIAVGFGEEELDRQRQRAVTS